MPEELVRAEDLSKYRQVASHAVSIDPVLKVHQNVELDFELVLSALLTAWFLWCLQGLHSASVPGILALDLCPSDTNKVLTGTSTSSVAIVSTIPVI